MSAVDLETILLPEDISNEVSLHCLACKQRLGSIAYFDRKQEDGTSQVAVSVSLQADVLKDFRQGELEPTGGRYDLGLQGEGFFKWDGDKRA